MAQKEHDGQLEVKVTCGPHYERVIREQKLNGPPEVNRPPCPGGINGPAHGRASKGCLAGSGVLFVGHNGQVFPCGYLPVHCGNILQTSLMEIWNNSPELASMRDVGQLKGKCGVCGFRAVCGGCRARAFAATGDYMDAEPMCTYIPPKQTQKPSDKSKIL